MKKILSIILCAAMLLSSFAFTALAEGDPTDAAQNVIEMIQALDENSTPAQIRAAIEAYEALSEEEKETVWNFDHIEELEASTVASLITDITALGDLMAIDYYSKYKTVNELYTKYDALSDGSKEKVTNAAALIAAKEKIEGLLEWNESKSVNLLNSALRGFSKYTIDTVRDFSEKTTEGIYYFFEEVDMIERGDSTTGYYHPESLDLVTAYKYAKLDFDVKFTDVDIINGWPAPFRSTIGGELWAGYDFVNGVFFQAKSGQDHCGISDYKTYTEYDMDFGVWHHMTITYNKDSLVYVIDGEEVLNTTSEGVYDYFIIYPWLCNLEMTNVYLYYGTGKELLSPFRTYVADPRNTGWTRSTNDSDATMLDLVQTSVDEARERYDDLSEDEKALIVGIDELDRVQALIDIVREGKNSVTVTDGTADVEYAAPGTTVTLTANEAPEGTQFYQWEIVSGEFEIANATSASATFVMPNSAVEVKATYKEKSAADGDVNGDGKVNSRDVIAVMKAVVEGKSAAELPAADLNGDGKLNSRDVIAVMKAVLTAQA